MLQLEKCKTLSEIYSISKTSQAQIFCRGDCSEASKLDDLCQACVIEYYDYEREKYE